MARKISLVGQTIAQRFRVVGTLGEGAMASVYRAEQATEPRQIALKVMHPHLASEPVFVRRFRREAKAAALVQHPNVVRILDHGVDGELAYIAMELLDGRDLFTRFAAGEIVSPARIVRIVRDICEALDAAHSNGLVHRDLKLENVMILEDPAVPGRDVVKVLDFGIAKLLEPEEIEDMATLGTPLTNTGAVVGTPEYMSPEQCQGIPVDHRADLYSLGVVLFQLATGRLPFAGPAAVHTMLMHVRDAPPRPRDIAPHLPEALDRVILQTLEKTPDARPRSARELATMLEGISRELEPSSSPMGRAAFVAMDEHDSVTHLDPRYVHSDATPPPAPVRPEPRPLDDSVSITLELLSPNSGAQAPAIEVAAPHRSRVVPLAVVLAATAVFVIFFGTILVMRTC